MSNLATLTAQRDGLLKKIREIEAPGNGVEKILEAIKNQRWYFFKNKQKVFMDRNTGILWANLDYYPYNVEYSAGAIEEAIMKFAENNDTGFKKWRLPEFDEFCCIMNDKEFPFMKCTKIDVVRGGFMSQLGSIIYWFVFRRKELGFYNEFKFIKIKDCCFGKFYNLPCTSCLVEGLDYEKNVAPENKVYTEKERLQFTLDLFTKNELWPIFDDAEVTELYKQIYFEKPKLLAQLQELQTQIKGLQKVTLLSSDFDYTALLAKYDLKAIDASLIKYYQAVQQWCRELMEKVDYYEEQKASVIKDFNLISLKLSKKYEANSNLTEAENTLLCDRQRFFQKNFSLGMNSVKTKLLAVKKQADALEYSIDEIDEGENSLRELAELEQEKRASFAFLAENTAKIIKNALRKIEYFEANHTFVMNAINIWENWTEGYRVFKTTYKEDMKHDCEDDGIEEEIWSAWYQDWQQLRYAIELKMQPVIERGLRGSMPTNKEVKTSVPEQLIHILDDYKKQIDKFYKEERKGIYQKFAFQAGGDLQEKFETESSLYKFVAMLQSELQDIIFNCKNAEDRVWILNWANSLLDIQIDEVLKFVANNDLQKISHTILDEFAALKQKNYDIYLADAKAYSEEKARREKAYNSLIFKMRKDLAK
mgnify:FL=1